MGSSPHEYQIELRLSYAKELLKYTDLPVNEIAERCGINQASHFINLLNQGEHITPLQFREKLEAMREGDACDLRAVRRECDMDTLEVLTLVPVIFAALAYIDNHQDKNSYPLRP